MADASKDAILTARSLQMAASYRRIGALLLLALLPACGLTGPSELDQLEAARARWHRSPLRDSYFIELTRSCFCPYPGAFPWTRVEVVNGAVVDAWELPPRNPIPNGLLANYPTVPALFDLIAHELANKSAVVRVEYDPGHGAPMQIYFDRIRQAIDDELSITIHALGAWEGT